MSVAKELIESLRASREAGEEPGVGRTEKAVTGFRSRAGRTFRAKLRLEQTDEGKWRVEFDEEWAKEPPKGESEEERAEREAAGGRRPTATRRPSRTGSERRRPPKRQHRGRRGRPRPPVRTAFVARSITPLSAELLVGNLPWVSGGCRGR